MTVLILKDSDLTDHYCTHIELAVRLLEVLVDVLPKFKVPAKCLKVRVCCHGRPGDLQNAISRCQTHDKISESRPVASLRVPVSTNRMGTKSILQFQS